MEPTVAVTVRAALVAWRPLRWAFDALGIGRRPARGSAKDSQFWRAFAGRFHLTDEPQPDGTPRLRGAIEGIAFSVGASVAHGEPAQMVMTATSRVALTAGTALHGIRQRTRTGDEGFDARCRVTGEPDVVVAALDAHARTQVAALLAGGGRVIGGQATLKLPSKLDEEEARAGANLVFHAAYAIDHEVGARLTRLLRIADDDPAPAVRARALWCAASLNPRDPGVQERLTRASHKPTDRHQDWIGRFERGDLSGCTELLVEAEDPTLVHLAGLAATHGDLGVVLGPLSTTEKPDLQLALAEVALHADDTLRLTLLGLLAKSTSLTSDEGVDALQELVVSCRELAGEDFDRTMASLAAHTAEPVADVAIGALLKHGTVRAVPALRAEEARVPRARAERIRSVIAGIQAAVGPVEAGRLTIAEDDGRGRVSVAPEAGSMSAPDDDAQP